MAIHFPLICTFNGKRTCHLPLLNDFSDGLALNIGEILNSPEI